MRQGRVQYPFRDRPGEGAQLLPGRLDPGIRRHKLPPGPGHFSRTFRQAIQPAREGRSRRPELLLLNRTGDSRIRGRGGPNGLRSGHAWSGRSGRLGLRSPRPLAKSSLRPGEIHLRAQPGLPHPRMLPGQPAEQHRQGALRKMLGRDEMLAPVRRGLHLPELGDGMVQHIPREPEADQLLQGLPHPLDLAQPHAPHDQRGGLGRGQSPGEFKNCTVRPPGLPGQDFRPDRREVPGRDILVGVH